MTCELALRLDDGLVYLADTRSDAGVGNAGTYRGLHVLFPSTSAGSAARPAEPAGSPGGGRLHRRRRPGGRAPAMGRLDGILHHAVAAGLLGAVERRVRAAVEVFRVELVPRAAGDSD